MGFSVFYEAGIVTELFPLLIFIGVGAMIDFRPLLALPHMALLAPQVNLAYTASFAGNPA